MLRLQVCPAVCAGLEVTAKIIQFLPAEVIVQVSQDLDTISITGAQSASFPFSWRVEEHQACRQLQKHPKPENIPAYPRSTPRSPSACLFFADEDAKSSVLCRSHLPVSWAPVLALFSGRRAKDMGESRSRSLERALARRDITVPAGQSRIIAIS